MNDMKEENSMKKFLLKLIPSYFKKKFEGRINLQRVLANTSWLFLDRILRMGVGLFIGVWVARYLGPEQFGVLSYAQAFVALFAIFATLGLDGIVVRDIVRNPEKKEEILGTSFTLKMVGGIVALLVTTLLAYFFRSEDTLMLWIIIIIASSTMFQAFNVIEFWFQSQVLSKYVVLAKNIAFIVIAIIKVILILLKAPLIAFAAAFLIEVIIGSMLLVVVYIKKGGYFSKWEIKISTAKSLLKDSWPLILSGMVVMVYMRIDQIMLGNMVGDHAVGIYTAATRLSEVWYFIPTVIVASVAPLLTQYKKGGNEKKYYQSLEYLFTILVAIGLILAIIMTFMSGIIIDLLYGTEFDKSSDVLAIHIWAAIFVFIGVARGTWLLNEGLMKFSFYTTLVGAVVNVLLNFILIPKFGPVGAAWTTLVSQAIASVGSCFLWHRTRKIGIMIIKSILFIQLFKKEKP